ncbi:hypothetical protein [Cellulosilyticum sp. I15G10I2]|uniref:hypothetical protein n=1 Tax=Cellulosilyticum sp. I15G10I2 TaxID=1892843 RepID=UPI00085C62ED|nr:hypothetical protein [Cellulosilyticum sp. I15G10I2]
MKRKYGTRLKDYFTNDVIVVALFILAIISGSVYALYIKDRDSSVFLMLNNYILLDAKTSFQIEKVLSSIYGYFKQLIVIWLFGLFAFTLPLSLGAFFIMVFSYAFTTTCIILIYGIKGLMVAVFAYGLQAIIMLAIAMYLGISSIRKSSLKVPYVFGNNFLGIIPMAAGSCVIALLDVLTISNLHYIVTLLL